MIDADHREFHSRRLNLLKLLFLGILVLGLLPRLAQLQRSSETNDVYLEVANVLQGGASSEVMTSLEHLESYDPANAAWAEARLAELDGWPLASYFEVILQDPEFLHYARAAYPENVDLATLFYQYHPNEWRAVGWLADVLLSTDPEKAVFYYQKATELNPTDDLNWRHLAELTEWSDPETAIEAAHTACRLNPVADGSCFREALVAFRLREWERCVESYEFLIERGSILYPERWVQFILSLEQLGRADEAERRREEALEAAPADYGALFDQYAITEAINN